MARQLPSDRGESRMETALEEEGDVVVLKNIPASCRWAAFPAVVLVVGFSAGCARSSGAAMPPPPVEVRIAEVRQADVPVYKEWIGTLDGFVNADIKAQISGYLTEQAYTEGTFVKKGQLLFQIDPRPYQADLDQASGRLA